MQYVLCEQLTASKAELSIESLKGRKSAAVRRWPKNVPHAAVQSLPDRMMTHFYHCCPFWTVFTSLWTQHKDEGRVRAHNQTWMPIVCLMARNHHQITGLKQDVTNLAALMSSSCSSGSALLPLVLIAVSILAASLSGSKFGSGTTVGYVGSPYREEQCDHSRNRWIKCIHYIYIHTLLYKYTLFIYLYTFKIFVKQLLI